MPATGGTACKHRPTRHMSVSPHRTSVSKGTVDSECAEAAAQRYRGYVWGMIPSCVLCQTCANSTRRIAERERRRPDRLCAAGRLELDDLFDCPSYVRSDELHKALTKRVGRNGRIPDPRSN
jgi:hypothetical protein